MSTKRHTGELTAVPPDKLELSDNVCRFLEFIRRVKWGTVAVTLKNSEPTSCLIISRHYRMDDPNVLEDLEIFVSEKKFLK